MSATASEARPSRTGTLLGEKLQDSDANPIKACISLFNTRRLLNTWTRMPVVKSGSLSGENSASKRKIDALIGSASEYEVCLDSVPVQELSH